MNSNEDTIKFYDYLSQSKRDYYMAQNLDYLLNKYKGQKIIIWASAFHIKRNTNILKEQVSYLKYRKVMWDYLCEKYKQESYSIAFTYYGGRSGVTNFKGNPFIDYKGRESYTYQNLLPINALESLLARTNYSYCFLDFTKIKKMPGNPIREPFFMSPSYEKAIRANWYEIYDAIFFIKEMTPVRSLGVTELNEYFK